MTDTEFTDALTRYRPCLLRTARRMFRQHAEDAVQEGLLRAWAHRDQFRGESAITTWLYICVVRAGQEMYRRRRFTQPKDFREWQNWDPEHIINGWEDWGYWTTAQDRHPSPEQQVITNELLCRIFIRLKPRERQALAAQMVGITSAEQSRMYRRPRSVVYDDSYRALRAGRAILAGCTSNRTEQKGAN